jgi:hypothetical protein
MKARQLIESAIYDPDQVKALGQAFDAAWARIGPTVSSRAHAIEAARLKLASIVLGLAKAGNFDPQQLADAAVQQMLAAAKRRQ